MQTVTTIGLDIYEVGFFRCTIFFEARSLLCHDAFWNNPTTRLMVATVRKGGTAHGYP